jgi:XTP/dITP diphosphohydrolase
MPETFDNRIAIVLATSNRDKVKELRPLLENISSHIRVYSLNEIGIDIEIEETEATLEGNALLKARAVFNFLTERFPFLIALADDTGLEVDALNGAPGVYSARFAPMPDGLTPAYKDNVLHLLRCMKGVANREARFRTVIALKGVLPSSAGDFEFEHTAEGMVPGSITHEEQGKAGFGYDPLFLVQTTGITYAEMSMAEKNRLSHRSLAVQHAIDYLKTLLQQKTILSNDTKTHP